MGLISKIVSKMIDETYFKKMFGEWIRTATHDGQADFQGGMAIFRRIARAARSEALDEAKGVIGKNDHYNANEVIAAIAALENK